MPVTRVAIVTGGSRGIGRAICLRLGREGHPVVVNYLKEEEKAKSVVGEIEASAGKAVAFQADVSTYEGAGRLVEFATASFGAPGILVNNAGVTADRTAVKMKFPEWDRVLQVNLNGTFFMCQHVLPKMISQNYGRIVSISSIIGITGAFGQANYAASKAGVIALTKCLARETAKYEITANAVAPGFIGTDMTFAMPPNALDRILEASPKRRLGTPEEVAWLVCRLAEEEAGFVTGQVFNINGGLYM